jgi:hypothetical protein
LDYSNSEYYELEIISILPSAKNNSVFHKKGNFQQQGDYLIFGENALRIIHFYSVAGIKTHSIKSTDTEINPSLYLNQKGIYIIEIIESDKRYSGKYINF